MKRVKLIFSDAGLRASDAEELDFELHKGDSHEKENNLKRDPVAHILRRNFRRDDGGRGGVRSEQQSVETGKTGPHHFESRP